MHTIRQRKYTFNKMFEMIGENAARSLFGSKRKFLFEKFVEILADI